MNRILALLAGAVLLLSISFAPDVAAAQQTASASSSSSSVRLGIQTRIDAFNLLGFGAAASPVSIPGQIFVPIATPGVRLVDDRLFLGLGLGFAGYSDEDSGGDTNSRSAFSMSPLASFDLIMSEIAAFYILGWFNFVSVGDSESCNMGTCTTANNGASGLGLNFGAGVRGKINDAMAIGGEFGWGFLSVDDDGGTNVFIHGLFGTILFEATIGL